MANQTTYKDRRAFGDSCLDEAKAIIADYFRTNISEIETADDYLDCKEATDFLCGSIRIAYRCRNASFLSRYPNDITIRLDRRSGLSEWQKIQAEKVRYMLYAFEDKGQLTAWKLIDLRELQAVMRWAKGTPWALSPLPHAPDGQEPFMSIDLAPLERNGSARASVVIAEG